jgi:NADH dehydrogenase
MGDILGGGLILTLGSLLIVLAGLDTSSAYGGIGSSRAVMVAILAEPTLILVFVGITLLAKAMLPFVVNHLLVSSWAVYWSPAHLFLVAAFFILLLVETDRMPIHSSTHIEVYMIDEGRILEYTAPLGVGNEAIHPLHNLLQRADLALGVVGRGYGTRCGRSRCRLDHQIRSCRLCGRLRRDRPVAPTFLPLSGAARRLRFLLATLSIVGTQLS